MESTLTAFAAELLAVLPERPLSKRTSPPNPLVASNLRGVDSHGLQLLPFYLEQILAGEIGKPRPMAEWFRNPDPAWCSTRKTPLVNGLPILLRPRRAPRRTGAAAVVVARESNHFGAAAWWAQKMRAAGQIGLVFCNASPIVPPWQGKQGRIGTNPICMSVPGPWLSTWLPPRSRQGTFSKRSSITSRNSPGWAFDGEGVPTTDTAAAYKGMLMPLGGYKGSGLGFMVEILCWY